MITENRDVPKLETKGKIYKHMEKKVKCGIRKYFYLIMKLPTRSIGDLDEKVINQSHTPGGIFSIQQNWKLSHTAVKLTA